MNSEKGSIFEGDINIIKPRNEDLGEGNLSVYGDISLKNGEISSLSNIIKDLQKKIRDLEALVPKTQTIKLDSGLCGIVNRVEITHARKSGAFRIKVEPLYGETGTVALFDCCSSAPDEDGHVSRTSHDAGSGAERLGITWQANEYPALYYRVHPANGEEGKSVSYRVTIF